LGFHPWGGTLAVDFEKKRGFNVNESLKWAL